MILDLKETLLRPKKNAKSSIQLGSTEIHVLSMHACW